MDPPDHGKIRSALKPGYAGSALYPRMEQLLESQLRLIQAWPMDTPISVYPHMKRLVCLLLGYLATNEDPGEVLDDIIFLFEAVIKIHVLRTWPGFAKHLPNYLRSRRRVLAMTKRIWEERYAEDMLNEAGDFVALVRSAQTEFPELLTDNDARASIMGPPSSQASTTVAAGISFLLYNVLSRPWLQEAVVAEADAAMADGLHNATVTATNGRDPPGGHGDVAHVPAHAGSAARGRSAISSSWATALRKESGSSSPSA